MLTMNKGAHSKSDTHNASKMFGKLQALKLLQKNEF